MALVRYRMNDYSVPPTYGFRDVLVKGFVDEVAILCGAVEIARHPRVYGRGQFVFDPMHYLALLEQKPGALDQAAPLQNWILPGLFNLCAGCWKPAWATVASASSSRCCG